MWGRMFVRICPYLPFSARVCLNQHHWLANRMGEEGIAFKQCASERNGPAAEQAPTAQLTRHGRPSDKGQKGCPAIGLLWAPYRRAKCLLSGEFPPSPPSFRPGFSRSCAGFFRPEFSYIFFPANYIAPAGLTACACGTRHLGLACHESPQPTLSPRRILGAYAACNELRTHRSLNKDPALRRPSRAACSASVSHLSAISMKSDLCCEVRAASANRMHSAALLRNWSKLGKSAFISIDMGTERAHRQRFVISRSMSFK